MRSVIFTLVGLDPPSLYLKQMVAEFLASGAYDPRYDYQFLLGIDEGVIKVPAGLDLSNFGTNEERPSD